MATLTANQLARMRKRFRNKDGASADYIKPQINGAFQAIEDYIRDSKQTRPPAGSGTWNSVVNTATSPFVFNLARKDTLLWAWAVVIGRTT